MKLTTRERLALAFTHVVFDRKESHMEAVLFVVFAAQGATLYAVESPGWRLCVCLALSALVALVGLHRGLLFAERQLWPIREKTVVAQRFADLLRRENDTLAAQMVALRQQRQGKGGPWVN